MEVETSGHMLAQLLRGAPLAAVDGNLQQRQVVLQSRGCVRAIEETNAAGDSSEWVSRAGRAKGERSGVPSRPQSRPEAQAGAGAAAVAAHLEVGPHVLQRLYRSPAGSTGKAHAEAGT